MNQNSTPEHGLSADQARKFGEIIEAQWVLLSEYQMKGGKCSLGVQAVDVGTGKALEKLTFVSSNWLDGSTKMLPELLRQIEGNSGLESKKWQWRNVHNFLESV